jgi:small ligand-binding sensory domain FIST
MTSPRFASSLSTDSDSSRAERAALDELDGGLAGHTPDLVVAFATHHHGSALEELGPRIARRLGARHVIGCTAESVIGGEHEIEGRPGLALWAAELPQSVVRSFEVQAHADEDGDPVFSQLPPVESPARTSLLLLADPYTFPTDHYLQALNDELPGVPAMGGIASGASGPGQTLFFSVDGVREAGAMGVSIEGGVELLPVVSQGCRPVGKPWVITECERNVIHKLAGRPALEVMMETWSSIAPDEQRLMQNAPFVGLAIDPSRPRFERGDFLVRGLMGLDQRARTIAVADFVRRGQTVCFLVRDASTAGEDLRQLMASQGGGPLPAEVEARSAGALLFSCNGRGCRMFKRPDHDIGCVRAVLDRAVPTAGFFAAGEIGPVGGRNFLHGFTASVAVFRPRTA